MVIRCFDLADAAPYGPLRLRTLRAPSELFVTHAKYDGSDLEQLSPATMEAVVVELQLTSADGPELWEGGVARRIGGFVRGRSNLYDLRDRLGGAIREPFEQLRFFLPLSSLDEAFDTAAPVGSREIVGYQPGLSVADPIVHQLGAALLPVFQLPEQANTLFVDHLLLAMRAHVVTEYFGLRVSSVPARGALGPRQLRRAQEILMTNLAGDVALAELARDCGLSLSHFTRAFRNSTGLPPHRWLLNQRVAKAKQLLRSTLPLSEVALACGFHDQSHFTRVFSRLVGLSPGAWRHAAR